MLGNPDLERKWLEMTYDGVMTVTGKTVEFLRKNRNMAD